MELLPTIWFIAIAALWIGYLLLEGFDLGVGMLLLFSTRSDKQRRLMLNAIGPVWDGNEVWLITVGAATFAAFPFWYASLFSALYIPLTIVLVSLIFRAVAIEYRGKGSTERWRIWWDRALGFGSLGSAFGIGAALALTTTGLPINENGDRVGGAFAWFTPYAVLGGLAVVVPMGCRTPDYPVFLRTLFKLTNLRGALITMPHKVPTAGLVDELLPSASIAGACNAVRRGADGALQGDLFDGEGFVRGVQRKGLKLHGAGALVVGSGGVGSAIAASLAAAGVARLSLFDVSHEASDGLGERLRQHYPALQVSTGSNDPAGFDLVVNATPLGMNPGDPMPMEVSRIDARTFVGEVVMKTEMTAFLEAARVRGCAVQIGSDMLFEQIPAYLEFFGLPGTTPDELRSLSTLAYG